MLEKIPSANEVIIKDKFVERYKALLGNRYDKFMEYSTSYIRKSIRVNTLKAEIDKVRISLEKNWFLSPIPWCKEGFWIDHRGEGENKRYDIGNVIEHFLGKIYVQDAASMIPPVVLKPKKGELVLDMCASPGSKTSQMAAMMENQGLLMANELQGERLKSLGLNLQRVGAKNVIVTQMPGHKFKDIGMLFDKVLVDAPCSGTGTIRRSLITLKMWSPQLVKKMSAQQKQLIETGFEILKEGGIMVYSTCTMEPEEDEGVVNWLLNKYPNAILEEIKIDIVRSPAITEFMGEKYNLEVSKCLRIWPDDNDCEGFFIAKIRKK
jgi:NOL1/NOP2/sun family putative RNA methylase